MELIPFTYEGTAVRTIIKDGEPWFVLADLCKVLDIKNARMVAGRLSDSMKGVSQIDTPGGVQEMTVVTEAGMYSVVMRSDKPEAVRFQEWVTGEVLPSIRKTGHYGTPQLSGPELMAAALIEAQKTLEAAQQRAIEAETKVVELAPKARQFDNFLNAEGDYSVTQAAQALNRAGAKTGRNRLHATLEALKWIYKPKGHRHWRVYQQASDRGLLRVRPTTWRDQHTGVEYASHTIRVTPKGLDLLAAHFGVTITPTTMEGIDDNDAA